MKIKKVDSVYLLVTPFYYLNGNIISVFKSKGKAEKELNKWKKVDERFSLKEWILEDGKKELE